VRDSRASRTINDHFDVPALARSKRLHLSLLGIARFRSEYHVINSPKRRTYMKAIITGLLSAGLLVTFAATGNAANKERKHRRHYSHYYSSPSTTAERQLRNERAYERGDWYEHDSNALRPGSRAWFEQKERESGDH
jgi:hypothetical protein